MRRGLLALGAVLVVVAAVSAGLAVGSRLGGASRTGGPHGHATTREAHGWTRVAGAAGSGWSPTATSLPHGHDSTGPMRVGAGVAPPTNRWYSGMFFGKQPEPVYAMPLAAQAAGDAITICLPTVSASPTTISGEFAPQFQVGLPTRSFAATRTGPVSFTATYTAAGGQPTGRLTMAEGWPYVSYTATRPQNLTLPGGLAPQDHGTWLSSTVGGTTYGVAVSGPGGVQQPVRSQNGHLHLSRGQSLLLFAGPDARTARTLAQHAVPVTGTRISYRVRHAATATRISYRTEGGRPTVVAAMPQDQLSDPPTRAGTVPSVYGPQRLYVEHSLTWHVRTVPPRGVLDLHRLSGSQRAELRRQVRTDVAHTLNGPAPPSDTYFGGKDVYRSAQLYRLARASGADGAASRMRHHVVGELDQWLDPSAQCPTDASHCFYYDTGFHGVVGRSASFGSDQFNDHHFHYGYFLAAAALVAEGHPALLHRWHTTLNALAEDIASPKGNASLPALRVFDPYAGHSWASGTAPFADGNNQESSSEAVNAWNGLALWARAAGNQRLARQATWQLSLESAAARTDWLQPRNLQNGYGHPFVSLNWGGKRDWSTWFSAKPSAILGIQLIPMPPVLDAEATDPERVRANLADAAPNGYHTEFGDYLTMYLATVDPHRALGVARQLPDSSIDPGDSRSYLLAWVLAHASR